MRLNREISQLSKQKDFTIESNSGLSFLQVSFFLPFRSVCNLLELRFMIDKIFPGFEVVFSFFFFTLYFRTNKPETLEYFKELEKEDLKNYTMISMEDTAESEESESTV